MSLSSLVCPPTPTLALFLSSLFYLCLMSSRLWATWSSHQQPVDSAFFHRAWWSTIIHHLPPSFSFRPFFLLFVFVALIFVFLSISWYSRSVAALRSFSLICYVSFFFFIFPCSGIYTPGLVFSSLLSFLPFLPFIRRYMILLMGGKTRQLKRRMSVINWKWNDSPHLPFGFWAKGIEDVSNDEREDISRRLKAPS